jgi:hypothetical protein
MNEEYLRETIELAQRWARRSAEAVDHFRAIEPDVTLKHSELYLASFRARQAVETLARVLGYLENREE